MRNNNSDSNNKVRPAKHETKEVVLILRNGKMHCLMRNTRDSFAHKVICSGIYFDINTFVWANFLCLVYIAAFICANLLVCNPSQVCFCEFI